MVKWGPPHPHLTFGTRNPTCAQWTHSSESALHTPQRLPASSPAIPGLRPPGPQKSGGGCGAQWLSLGELIPKAPRWPLGSRAPVAWGLQQGHPLRLPGAPTGAEGCSFAIPTASLRGGTA